MKKRQRDRGIIRGIWQRVVNTVADWFKPTNRYIAASAMTPGPHYDLTGNGAVPMTGANWSPEKLARKRELAHNRWRANEQLRYERMQLMKSELGRGRTYEQAKDAMVEAGLATRFEQHAYDSRHTDDRAGGRHEGVSYYGEIPFTFVEKPRVYSKEELREGRRLVRERGQRQLKRLNDVRKRARQMRLA